MECGCVLGRQTSEPDAWALSALPLIRLESEAPDTRGSLQKACRPSDIIGWRQVEGELPSLFLGASGRIGGNWNSCSMSVKRIRSGSALHAAELYT